MRLAFLSFISAVVPAVLVAQGSLGTITYQDWTGASAPEQNIRFSQLDSGTPIPGGLTYQSNRMLNAAGAEVPWQQMSNGELMVRPNGIPASKFPGVLPSLITETGYAGAYTMTYGFLPASGSYFRGASGNTCTAIPKNSILRFSAFTGGTLPGGISAGKDYFVVACGAASYLGLAVSASYNGPPVAMSYGAGFLAQQVPFAASGNQLISIAHGYADGTTLEFDVTDTGALPGGLAAHTLYFVCNASKDTFQVSTGGNCGNIVTTTAAATGVPEIISSLSWTLQNGAATTARSANEPSAVVNGNVWELSNGLTGVRLPTAAYEAASGWSLAPIQSLRFADGSWTPGAGAMTFDVGKNHTTATAGTSYSITAVEKGLLEVSLQASLAVNRALNVYGGAIAATVTGTANTFQASGLPNGPYALSVMSPVSGLSTNQIVYAINVNHAAGSFQVSAAPGGAAIALGSGTAQFLLVTQEPGPGYYNVKVTLDANTRAVMVLEDHNIHDYRYNLNLRPTLTADTARFRSNGAPPSNMANSYVQVANGSGVAHSLAVPSPPGIGNVDYFVDLLGADRTSSYNSSGSTLRSLGSQYEPNNQAESGHYWMLYNSAGSTNSNVAGLFLGKGSLQYYGESLHGPGVFDTPSSSAQGFSLWDAQPAPTQTYYSGEVKRSFGFWMSTKADLLAPTMIQPIDIVRGTLAGINVNRVKSYNLNFADPVNGWSSLYENNAGMSKLSSLLKDGTSLCGFADCLYAAVQGDGVQQPLADLLRDNTAPRISTALAPMLAQLHSFADDFYNKMGNMDGTIAYYQGAYPCVRYSSMASLIMASPAATAWQKQQAKHFMGFCAGFLWDPDFYSADPSISGGLGNQQSQFLQQKAQFATELSSDPAMQPLVTQSVQNIQSNLLAAINPYGSGYGSWHYQAAATQQAIFGWLNLANSGKLSIANFPQVAKFGQWYLSGITPPEVRFGKLRMYISNGDGNTEAETDPGLLAALLNPNFPTLASQLMWTWYSQGLGASTLSSFSAPSLLAMNFSIPPADPKLTSQHFPGSHSMLRSGWNTPFENAADFLYGGFYSAQGHAHTDTGRVAAYLLGAPVSIDWNANLYNPEVSGRFQHSTVCLDSELAPAVWNQDNSPLNACGSQFTGSSPDSTNLLQTSTFSGSSSATASWTKRADGTTFTRTVTLLNYDPNYAILHTYDAFSGAQANSPKTLTWNLMADHSTVQTPAGAVVPAVRQNLGNNGVLPSSSPAYNLNGNGLQRFAFQGANWANHSTGGVDFDLYTQNADQHSFVIGNWCHNQYGNNCALESQDIVRLHGSGNFDTWIVARKKGSADPAVSDQACGTQIVLAGTLCFNQSYSQYADATSKTLATYDRSSHSAFGMTISGGPAECVETSGQIACTIHGWQASTRVITLPAGYYAAQPTVYDMSGNVLAYSGNGQPLHLTFTTSSTLQGHVILNAPSSGADTLMGVNDPATGQTISLASVASGAMVFLHAPPNPYQVIWTSDSGQVETLQVDVPYTASGCGSTVSCNPRLQ